MQYMTFSMSSKVERGQGKGNLSDRIAHLALTKGVETRLCLSRGVRMRELWFS